MNLRSTLKLTKPIKANGPCGCTLTVGDPVTVDGLPGRGVIVARKGRDLVVRYRSGEYLKRDQRYVHKISSDYVSRYSSVKAPNVGAAAEDVEMSRGPIERPPDGYIVKEGTLFCVKSRNKMDVNFGCFNSREEAETHLGYLHAYGTSEGAKKGWEGRTLYHVTRTNLVDKIKNEGLKPMQTSNWVKGADKQRYGSGEIYTFEHPEDAVRWAGKMDWAFNKSMGTGKISVVKVDGGKQAWKEDNNDPIAHATSKGKWLKYAGHIPPAQIKDAVPVTHDLMQKIVKNEGVSLNAYGTSEGVKKEWDARGRGLQHGPQGRVNAPDGKMGYFDPEKGGLLFHGTNAPGTKLRPGELYTAVDYDETAAFAKGEVPGAGGRGRSPSTMMYKAKPGKLVDVEAGVNDAIENGEEEDIKKVLNDARANGARYALFHHPSSIRGDEQFPVIVSLYPHEDLKSIGGWRLKAAAIKKAVSIMTKRGKMDGAFAAYPPAVGVKMPKVKGPRHHLPNPSGKGAVKVRMPNPSGHHGFNMRKPNASMGRLEADMQGEPSAGAMGQVHIDPAVWFHPPSLSKRHSNESLRVPTDDPQETNDKFGDVTQRKSKQTQEFRMKLLKRSAPGGLPAMIPARTTLVEPHSAGYTSLYGRAGKNVRRKRLGGRAFTSFENQGKI